MKTREIEIPDAGEKVSNPVYWMEKQANRGAIRVDDAHALHVRAHGGEEQSLKRYAHEGEKYEQIGLAIAEELGFRTFGCGRGMIQLGHIHAKGALNYVDRYRIQPYSFDEESLRQSEHTFTSTGSQPEICTRRTPVSGKCWTAGSSSMPTAISFATSRASSSRPRGGHMLTPWAIRHVDQCCFASQGSMNRKTSGDTSSGG